MKFFKRVVWILFILIALTFMFRKPIYRGLITYRSIGERTNYTAKDKELIAYIEDKANKDEVRNVKDIIKISLSLTAQNLNFKTSHTENDPNVLIRSKNAHCVGYSAFFATSCNYLLKKYAFNDEWTAKRQIGQLFFFGTNIHQYVKSSFFKDHDFVIIENKKTEETFAVDPSVNDYFWIDIIRYKTD